MQESSASQLLPGSLGLKGLAAPLASAMEMRSAFQGLGLLNRKVIQLVSGFKVASSLTLIQAAQRCFLCLTRSTDLIASLSSSKSDLKLGKSLILESCQNLRVLLVNSQSLAYGMIYQFMVLT